MEECQICLGDLSNSDYAHPLMCSTKCGFNMCFQCVTHLLSERVNSNSRTNTVKVRCPNCRGDLSATIRDTLTVRKFAESENLRNVPDSSLSGDELRTKHSVTESEALKAQERLDRLKYQTTTSSVPSHDSAAAAKSTSTSTGDSVGTSSSSSSSSLIIDKDLLQGLDLIMSQEEQIFVTKLMTSGDANQLAQAAQILSEIGHVVQNGYAPPKPLISVWDVMASSLNISSSSRRRSTSNNSNNNNNNITLTPQQQRAMEMSISTKQLQQSRALNNSHPLPKLPIHVILKANFDIYAKHRKVLKFKDDQWDGSVSDAFARAHWMQDHDNTNHDQHQSNAGNDDDDDDGDELSRNNSYENNQRKDEEEEEEEESFINGPSIKRRQRNRVIVTKARTYASKAGIRQGDVVSHVNGEKFTGTANDLKALINKFYLQGTGSDSNYTFSLVLNAEQSTAAALKLRAMVVNNQK